MSFHPLDPALSNMEATGCLNVNDGTSLVKNRCAMKGTWVQLWSGTQALIAMDQLNPHATTRESTRATKGPA